MTYTTTPCMGCGRSSQVQLDPALVARWEGGEPIQLVWPEMSADDRETLISGTHPACWDAMFPDEED